MQAAVKQRSQVASLRASVMKEKEEELALFLEMRKREKERNNLLLQNSEEIDAPIGSRTGNSPIFNIPSSAPARKTVADDFLNSDNDKNDYDWYVGQFYRYIVDLQVLVKISFMVFIGSRDYYGVID